MVDKRLLGIVVFSEAFVLLVVVHDIGVAFPTLMTLNAEVILGLSCQGAVARPRLQNALRQSDGCRNLVLAHLAHGDVLISFDIVFGRDALSR